MFVLYDYSTFLFISRRVALYVGRSFDTRGSDFVSSGNTPFAKGCERLCFLFVKFGIDHSFVMRCILKFHFHALCS